MTALIYLAIAVFFGDALVSRWFGFVTWLHRLASAFVVGLLVATWASYLSGVAFDAVGQALTAGNVVAAWLMLLAGIWLRRRPMLVPSSTYRAAGWDRLVVAAVLALVAWMMLSTYTYVDGQLGIAGGLWSDFGPTTAIAQNFALGDNFPTEYPHFAGEPIRYHFLYYFQVGNLTFLGLDPAAANNLLSVASLVSMLVLTMALGERLFGSPWVGRIGAVLFFFHGALSFIPYLASLGGPAEWAATIPTLGEFMKSGFPYRGEDWGIWTQMVFLNQRHLASAIGILLVIVLFLLERLAARQRAERGEEAAAAGRVARIRAALATGWSEARAVLRRPADAVRGALRDPALPGYVVCGVLAGLLPLYNGAMFIAAAAILAAWLVLFGNRLQMLVLAVAAAIPSIPQLLWVKPGTMAGEQTYPALYWGYVIDDPTPFNVARYLAFVFGPKLLLIAVALAIGTWRQWRVFVAFAGLVAVAFLIQLSVEVLANHKFINAWLIVANLFVAAGLVALWRTRGALAVPSRLVALGLAVVIVGGGVIDLVPIRNQGVLTVGLEGDPLFEWVVEETQPDDVFLTDLYAVHTIMLAGRRLHFGWPYYAWSAGYDVLAREDWYRQVFGLRSARELALRLRAAGVDWVAIDDALRERGFAPRLNEELFRDAFETAFEDEEGRYAHIAVYRVPTTADEIEALPEAPPFDMYTGGAGPEPGRFDGPRGIAVGRDGTVYVADTGNDRVQAFSSSGNVLFEIEGGAGDDGRGVLDEPVAVVATDGGRILVAAGGGRLLEFDRAGTFVRELIGPEPGFGTLTDLAAEGEMVYALDGSRGVVWQVPPDGSAMPVRAPDGADPGLRAPSGIAVAAGSLYVADAGNGRVVVLGTDGSVRASWPVAEWGGEVVGADVAAVPNGTVWLSVPGEASIVMYRADGTPVGRLGAGELQGLARPAGIALRRENALFVVDSGANRVVMTPQIQP